MEIEHLKIIQHLAVDPNLSRAAERLHMTQSALSKRLQAIEHEIGRPLFERRGPRGLRALPQALELAQLAERILKSWTSGIHNLKRTSEEPGHFILVGPQLFLREIILPWWKKNSEEFPELRLEVHVSTLARASIDTLKAGADAGILEHREEMADFVCKPIYTERWGIVRNPHLKSRDLSKHIWGTFSSLDNPVDTWLVRKQKIPPPTYRFYWEDLTAIAEWVAATSNSASVLPWHAVAGMVKSDALQFEPLGPDSTTKLYLGYAKKNPHKNLLQALSQISEENSL